MLRIAQLLKWGVVRWADGFGRRLLKPSGELAAFDTILQSAVPVIHVPSGTFTSTTGVLTLGTALTSIPNGVITAGGNAYVSLPAGAGGLSAGVYAATFTSTTQCQLVGNPTTTATAFTQSTGIVALVQIPLPAGVLGPSGSFELELCTSNNNSAGLKSIRCGLNASTGILVVQMTTGQGSRPSVGVQNRGGEGQQIATPVAGSYGGIGAPVPLSVDTSVASSVVISGQLATATDWLIIDSWRLKYRYGA